MMSDDEHLELYFDPLDDTKVWPEEQFPPKLVLAEDDQPRLANLGSNGPRDVPGMQMTHCVPNERVEARR